MSGLLVMLPCAALAFAYSWMQRRFAQSRRQLAIPGDLEAQEAYHPDVDVIVPCYNEEPAMLAACLRSLRTQEYQGG